MTMFDSLPVQALEIPFFEARRILPFPIPTESDRHRKTVPFAVIARPLEGSYGIACPKGSARILPGEAFITAADLPLTIDHYPDPATGRMQYEFVHIHCTLYGTLDVSCLLDMPLRADKAWAAKVGTIIDELMCPPTQQASALWWLVRRKELALSVLRLLCEISTMAPEGMNKLRHAPRLEATLRYIREHMAASIHVGDLADAAHMSASRFHAFFKEQMGVSPMDYVKETRLSQASRLLVASQRPIAEIAGEVGFQNQFHFSREFSARFGLPPSKYRKREAWPNS